MKKYISTFLTTIISFTLYIFFMQKGLVTNLFSQYKNWESIDTYQLVQKKSNINHFPITIHSDTVKGNYPNNIIFTGNVNIFQGNNHLRADEVNFNQKKSNKISPLYTLNASGNVYYDSNQIILKGLKGWVNLNTNDINIWNGNYQIVDQKRYGKAELIKQRDKNRYTILKNGSFTSCLPESTLWKVVGNEIIYDHKKQTVKVWNARFNLGSIPIFYIPYIKLPLGEKRCSSFLMPRIKYNSSNYFEFDLPYYWNIASDADLITTAYFNYKYGIFKWKNEFRYFIHAGKGLIELDYVPTTSKTYKNSHLEENTRHHWLLSWKHNGMMLNPISNLDLNYTRISDPNYFKSRYPSNNNDLSTLIFNLGYSVQNYNAILSIKKFQVLNKKFENNYSAIPQLDISWHSNNLKPFNFNIYSQAAHFIGINSDMPESTRVHLEPSMNISWVNNSYSNLNTEAKLITTHYQQKNFDQYNKKNNANLKNSVNRILPQFKIDGKILLKRNMKLNKKYTQTLENHIQYLYIPYHDQGDIQNYDSSLLDFNYHNLFLDRSYSGLDRISPTNQVKACFTTSFYDAKEIKRLNISIGQIYYFTESRFPREEFFLEKKNDKIGPLILVGNTEWYITKHLGLRGSIQYARHLNSIITGDNIIEYYQNDNCLMQLNYRFINKKYIRYILPYRDYINNNQCTIGVSQLGVIINHPINSYWSIESAYYGDNKKNKIIDQILGLKYNSCCCIAQFSYEHKLISWNNNKKKYDDIFNCNIELQGLSPNFHNGTKELLRSSMIPLHTFLS